MYISGKKGKKKGKGKTVSLNAFLGDSQAPGMVKQIDWADEAEEETYRSVSSCMCFLVLCICLICSFALVLTFCVAYVCFGLDYSSYYAAVAVNKLINFSDGLTDYIMHT